MNIEISSDENIGTLNISNVESYTINAAEFIVKFEDNAEVSNEELSAIIDKLAEVSHYLVGANWLFQDPYYGTQILVAVGEMKMKHLSIRVVD